MSVLPIAIGEENPVLRGKTKKVDRVTKDILTLIRDMEDTVAAAEGLGLAAPQVSHSERVCLVLMNGKMTPLINPDITWRSEETAVMEEGCLSLPKIGVDVERSVEVIVTYMDPSGKPQERRLHDLDARVAQHEVDHLEGILIVDYLKKVTRHKTQPAKL